MSSNPLADASAARSREMDAAQARAFRIAVGERVMGWKRVNPFHGDCHAEMWMDPKCPDVPLADLIFVDDWSPDIDPSADYAVLKRIRDTDDHHVQTEFTLAVNELWHRRGHRIRRVMPTMLRYLPGDYSRAALAALALPSPAEATERSGT